MSALPCRLTWNACSTGLAPADPRFPCIRQTRLSLKALSCKNRFAMHLPRIVISAPHRSSGKTTVSIGLCAALAGDGLAVQPVKKDPDFIDPMWLSAAAGRECRNLDLFMMGDGEIMKSVGRNGADAGTAVIEGNMGLFDSICLLYTSPSPRD